MKGNAVEVGRREEGEGMQVPGEQYLLLFVLDDAGNVRF